MQPMAACLALSLASASAASLAAEAPAATGTALSRDFLSARGPLGLPIYAGPSAMAKHLAPTHAVPSRPAATLLVTNCDNDGPGSLRDTINLMAMSGDAVDLSALPCSTITLTTGQITVLQDDLFLTGPGADALAIDGGGIGRVIQHIGDGRLTIIDLTITHGKYTATSYGYFAYGGCLASSANITLTNSTVSNCVAGGQDGATAFGGGIFTKGDLYLLNSVVTSTLASSTVDGAVGGGVYVRGNLQSLYSTISNNGATSPGLHNFGGGLFTRGNAHVKTSTISGNRSANDAAWAAVYIYGNSPTANIVNSTISGNVASNRVSGIYTTMPLTLSNSTIAFNEEGDLGSGNLVLLGALYSHGAALTLQSSIIADNISYTTGQALDLAGFAGATVAGANNLITSTSGLIAPADTVTDCPQLGPLADNGGVTLTHALLRDGPAVGAGNNTAGLDNDQRGPGFPRTSGFDPDIGAYEWQGTPDDRILASGFEVTCDR
jgi:hypothetical protein